MALASAVTTGTARYCPHCRWPLARRRRGKALLVVTYEEKGYPVRISPPDHGRYVERGFIQSVKVELGQSPNFERLRQPDLGPATADIQCVNMEELVLRLHDHGPRDIHPSVPTSLGFRHTRSTEPWNREQLEQSLTEVRGLLARG